MIVTNKFRSNCLIEAMKAKLKNPKKVRITFIPARYTGGIYPHFLWSDGESDFDFGTDQKLKPYQYILFRGNIRERSLGWNERYKQMLVERKRKTFKEEMKNEK